MNFVTNVLKKYIQNEPQEQKIPDITVSSPDKENGFFTPSGNTESVKAVLSPEKEKERSTPPEKTEAEIGLDVECATKPKLRISFLKAFDPLYSESSGERTVTPQLLPLSPDVSDEEATFVDAAAELSEEAGNKPTGARSYLEESLLKFHSPEKQEAVVTQLSEITPTSQVVHSDSVLPQVTEPVSTSETVHPHVEKRKLHEPNRLQQKIHSPVVVPCKKQRITGSEIAAAIRSKLQFEANREGAHEISQADIGEATDSNSEISDIKTDSPGKSQGEKSTDSSEGILKEVYLSQQFEDSDSYPELPETSDESSKGLGENDTGTAHKPSEKVEVLSSSETYPDLPETTDESSNGQLVVKEEVDASTKAECHPTTDSEIYPELPDTSEESAVADVLADKTFEVFPETTEEVTTPSSNIELVSQVVAVEKHPEHSERGVDGVIEKPPQEEASQGNKESSELTKKEEQEVDSSSDKQSSPKKVQNTCDELISAKDNFELKSVEESIAESPKSVEKELCDEKVPITAAQLEEVVPEDPDKKEEGIVESAEEVSDEKAEKELNNLSTKQKTVVQTEEKAEKDSSVILIEEEHKSVEDLHNQKPKDKVNTTVEICVSPEKKENLNTGVGSNEGSFIESPKSTIDPLEYPEKKLEEKVSDEEESKVKSNGQEILNKGTDKISEETVQNEKTEFLTESTGIVIPEKGDTETRDLKADEEKVEKDRDYSILTKITIDVASHKTKMADLSEKLSEQQQENSDLKLQLNASQQAKASLELEIRQKEEIIIKTQAEVLKTEQVFKHEIKQLREKLKENSRLIEKDGSKELEEQLKEAKARETKAITELNQRNKDDLNYQKIMEEYENTIATRFADYQKLKEEHETATRHLANIELAFSDVHQKYERSKTLLEGYRANEETLVLGLQASEKTCKQHEERYESLKAHAQAQIEKSNKEILMLRDKYEMDINKLKAIIKRLEIKCGSLEVSLQQKTEECAALSALCDEVTGKRM